MTSTNPALSITALALVLAACGGAGFSEPITLSGRVVQPQTLERGRDLFNRYCATCHGMDGKAQTSQARTLDPKPRDFTAAHFTHKLAAADGLPTDEELSRTIKNGVPGTGMPAWPNLDSEDLDAVIQYIKTFSPRWRGPAPTGASNERGLFDITPSERAGPHLDVGLIVQGHRAFATGVEDRFAAPTNVLPARHDAASVRAAFTATAGSPAVATTPSQTCLASSVGALR